MNGSVARAGLAAAALALVAAASPAAAQNYPSKQIELMVPFVAGGTTDTVARLDLAAACAINGASRPSSATGPAAAARSAPTSWPRPRRTDTRCSSPRSRFAINASLQKQPYDAIKDFTPITELSTIPLMLVVHPSLPISNLKEFIAYSKTQPNGPRLRDLRAPAPRRILQRRCSRAMSGAKLVHVPFKGNAEVINALRRRPCEGAFRAERVDVAACPHRHAARDRGDDREAAARRCPMCQPSPSSAIRSSRSTRGRPCSRRPDTPKDIVAKINGEIGRHAGDPGSARAHQQGRRRSRSAVRRSNSTGAPATRSTKWAKVVQERGPWPRSRLLVTCARLTGTAPTARAISATLSAAKPVSTAIVASAPCRSISSAPPTAPAPARSGSETRAVRSAWRSVRRRTARAAACRARST